MKQSEHDIIASVVILNWNGRKLLEQFLPSVVRYSADASAQVVVADNGSTDDSVAYVKANFPTVRVIELPENYGFAGGYNKALEYIDSKYVVLLNSDVEVTPNWLVPLIGYMEENDDVVAVQPKILAYHNKSMFEYAGASGGFIDKYGYPFCRGRIINKVEEDNGQYDTIIPVFWATGAALFIRLDEYKEAGGLDTRFFAHMEEIDLCWRLNARGHKIMCIPTSVVYHVGGASLGKENPKKLYLNFRNNLLMLHKNLPKNRYPTTFIVRFLFDAVAFLQLVVTGQFKQAKAVVNAYSDFLRTKSSFNDSRRLNISKTVVPKPSGQYMGSILIKFYTGCRTFSSLNKEHK
ncbi:MAG: glycosyltransferase family 2 protein [Fermentimonas sp.]|jgi:GT2 family glycosyltransferase